jgi:hypothetical protein
MVECLASARARRCARTDGRRQQRVSAIGFTLHALVDSGRRHLRRNLSRIRRPVAGGESGGRYAPEAEFEPVHQDERPLDRPRDEDRRSKLGRTRSSCFRVTDACRSITAQRPDIGEVPAPTPPAPARDAARACGAMNRGSY